MTDNNDTRDTRDARDNRDSSNNSDNSDTRDTAGLAREGDAATTSDRAGHEAGAADQKPQNTQTDASNLANMDVPARAEEAEDPYEGAVPPGYDWPTHGGYLGCLMGLVTMSILGTLVALPLFALLTVYEVVPLAVAWILTALVFLLCLIGGGRLGWALGKRFYREYPHDRPTWGESDDAGVEGVEAKDVETKENAKDNAGEARMRT